MNVIQKRLHEPPRWSRCKSSTKEAATRQGKAIAKALRKAGFSVNAHTREAVEDLWYAYIRRSTGEPSFATVEVKGSLGPGADGYVYGVVRGSAPRDTRRFYLRRDGNLDVDRLVKTVQGLASEVDGFPHDYSI